MPPETPLPSEPKAGLKDGTAKTRGARRASPPKQEAPAPRSLRRLRQVVRMSRSPRHRARMSQEAGLFAKNTGVALTAALLGEALLKQHTLTQEDVDLELKEYALQTAVQLIILSILL